MSEQLKEFDVFNCDLSGRHLIEASAGTGKTYTITSVYLRLLLETDLEPSDILVVTFTDAATAELKQRIRSRIQESVASISTGKPVKDDEFLTQLAKRYDPDAASLLKNKLDNFDEASIYTIHGFCNRLLTEYNILFDVAADFEMLTDDNQLLQDVVDDFWRQFVNNDVSEAKKVLIDLLANEGIGPNELKKRLKKLFARPYAQVVPSALDLNEFEKQLQELNSTFEEVKKVYKIEKDILNEFYFGNALNGTRYNSARKGEYYSNFEQWLGQEKPSLSYFDKLDKFGSIMPASIKKNETAPELRIFDLVDSFIELTNELRTSVFQFISFSYERAIEILREKKGKAGVLTYDDLLLKVWNGISGNDSEKLKNLIVSKYPVALVDEFQDTDPVQYSIFDSVYSDATNSCLFMIGDPKQSIYGFRGADIYTYVEARNSLKKENRYSLNYNYRSNNGLIESFNKLFTLSPNPFLLDSLYYQKVFAPDPSSAAALYKMDKQVDVMNLVRVTDDNPVNKGDATSKVSDAVIHTIIYLLDEKSGYRIDDEMVREKDIAILVRNRFQGQILQDKLRQAGIFSVLRSKDSVYNSSEAHDLLIVLTALADLQYDPFVKAALTTDLIGLNFIEITDLTKDSRTWRILYQHLYEIKKEWFSSGISSALQKLESLFNIQKTLGKSLHSHRKVTNFRHLKELLLRMEKEGGHEPQSLIKSFSNRINDPANSEDEEIRLENDEDLIQILTIHASKGLEFPIVFNPFLWTSEKTPNYGDGIIYVHEGGKKILDIRKNGNSDDRKVNELISFKNSISESVRLMYVALTRAKNASYIFLPDYPDTYLSPLGVVAQEPEQLEKSLSEKINAPKPKKVSVEEIANIHTGLFHTIYAENLNTPGSVNIPETKGLEVFAAKKVKRDDLLIKKKLISYTWLSRRIDDHYDHSSDTIEFNRNESEDKDLSPFTFSKGANAGSFLHEIFENIEFSKTTELKNIIDEKLQHFGFDKKWAGTVYDWILNCLDISLDGDDLKLNSLSKRDILKEMEFHFPINNIDLDEINKILKHNSLIDNRESVSGYMKGFIDLTFRWRDRFYIADYKSNYLGDKNTDYNKEALGNSIRSSQYDLQYYVYSVALDKYLRSRLNDYNYEKHFGGVYYLYLRGMNKDSDTGIFFDRPDSKKIKELSKILRS